MLARRRMLALVNPLYALLASTALADPGAYELGMKKAAYEGYLGEMRKRGADGVSSEKVADAFATCIAAHSVQGLSAIELDQPNEWARGGPKPNASLISKARAKFVDTAAAHECERAARSR
jgi:hypothetical protein